MGKGHWERALLGAFCLLALGACDNGIVRRDADIIGNNDSGAPPAKPVLDPTPPTVVAWPLITLRGTADGARRVLVRGAQNPLVTEVVPGGTFCIDVPIPMVQPYTLELLAHAEGGLFSEPETAMVEFDPSAPIGEVIPTCSGADPRGCMSVTEICDNNRDDDCDGRIDANDRDCATCANDLLEDNDALMGAPRLPPGEYADLVLCPDESDYYAVYLRVGEMLDATIEFVHENGDLDLEIYDATRAVVASSVSEADTEMGSFVAVADGEHHIRVFSQVAGATNTYRLSVAASR